MDDKPKDNLSKINFICPNRKDTGCVYYKKGVNNFCVYSNPTGLGYYSSSECNSLVANVNRMMVELKSMDIDISDDIKSKNEITRLTKHNNDLKRYLYSLKQLTFKERIKFIFTGKL